MPTQTKSPFDKYAVTIQGLPGYVAGLPGYPRNFSRDVFTAGIIAQDTELLTSQLAISSRYQGTKYDIYTGEEPGKIHHEYPGVSVGGDEKLYATYNACDTTSLYLIACDNLAQIDPGANVDARRPNIEAAVKYILNHVRDDLFYEFPPPGASHFALKSTYWKDSITLLDNQNRPLAYPVVYTLAHFQAARGLASAAKLLASRTLAQTAQTMFEAGITKLIAADRFVVAASVAAVETEVSSDELHCLAYIPANFATVLPLEQLVQRASKLQTAAGFACVSRSAAAHLSDTYHGYVVWPFEQAMIHYGAVKFGLPAAAAIAARVIPHIGAGQELMDILPTIQPRGNPNQLWSAAAALYFANPSLVSVNAI